MIVHLQFNLETSRAPQQARAYFPLFRAPQLGAGGTRGKGSVGYLEKALGGVKNC